MTEQGKWTIEGRDVFIDKWENNRLETITREEAELRLNEYETLKEITERLKAGVDEMMDAAKDDPNEMGGPFVSLSWVANILEGKDG